MNTRSAKAQDAVNLIAAQEVDGAALTVNGRRMRLLVAIASYGRKNDSFLRQIIQKYLSMALEVHVVVLSEAPKDLLPEVEVIIGLPSPNPWSLPFAHKPVLAENLDSYDLFIYSEDDMEFTEENLHAFLHATTQLELDEIAGYLRYEVGSNGSLTLPDVHGPYRWKPDSVKKRGDLTIAEFTNEHAGFYILTQAQLRKAIKSGGFLRGPCEGRYHFPETAATDPYSNCGFRKVICISVLEDFLIHHLPNRYVGQLGLPLSSFKEQIRTLVDIGAGVHPVSSLCRVESQILHGKWSKGYDEEPAAEALDAVPCGARTVLAIGSGSCASELQIERRGAKVTVIPLDSVVGASAARLGFEVIYGSLEECFDKLGERRFDCVFATNLLHLLSEPVKVCERCSAFVQRGGTLVLAGPNFDHFKIWIKRTLRIGDYGKLHDFGLSGIRIVSLGALKACLQERGFCVDRLQWSHETTSRESRDASLGWFKRLAAERWCLTALKRNDA